MDESLFSTFDDFDFENDVTFQKGWKAIKTVVDPEAVDVEYIRAKAFFFSKYFRPIDLEQYKSWKTQNLNAQKGIHTSKSEEHEHRKLKGTDVASKTVPQFSSHVSSCNLDSSASSKSNGNNLETKESNVHKTITQSVTSTGEVFKDLQGAEVGEEIKKELADGIKMSISEIKEGKSKNSEEEDEISGQDDSLSLTELALLVQNGLPIPGLISVDVQPTNKDPTPSSMARKRKPWEMKDSSEETSNVENS